MKKLLSVLSLFFIFSCAKTEPVEKYKNKGIVVIDVVKPFNPNKVYVSCKTKDSVFEIAIHPFDAKNLKVGDTL